MECLSIIGQSLVAKVVHAQSLTANVPREEVIEKFLAGGAHHCGDGDGVRVRRGSRPDRGCTRDPEGGLRCVVRLHGLHRRRRSGLESDVCTIALEFVAHERSLSEVGMTQEAADALR